MGKFLNPTMRIEKSDYPFKLSFEQGKILALQFFRASVAVAKPNVSKCAVVLRHAMRHISFHLISF